MILQVCDERDDKQAVSVRFRIQGSSSDLHPAEARYHNKCRISFMGKSNIKVAGNQYRQDTTENKALLTVINSIKNDINRAWTTVEIHKLYTDNNGFSMTRKTLMNKIEEHLTEEIIILSSPGVANKIEEHLTEEIIILSSPGVANKIEEHLTEEIIILSSPGVANKIEEHLTEEIIILSSPGVANKIEEHLTEEIIILSSPGVAE